MQSLPNVAYYHIIRWVYVFEYGLMVLYDYYSSLMGSGEIIKYRTNVCGLMVLSDYLQLTSLW